MSNYLNIDRYLSGPCILALLQRLAVDSRTVLEATHLSSGQPRESFRPWGYLTDGGFSSCTPPGGAAKPFLFTVDATAVRLTVHPDFLRDPDPFRPAFAKIPVEEGNPLLHGHTLSDAPNEIVFLKAAVEKGRRKGVESTPSGDLLPPG